MTKIPRSGGCRRRDYAFRQLFDPIEDGVRERVRGFIETMLEEELDCALSRPRYDGGRRLQTKTRSARRLPQATASVC